MSLATGDGCSPSWSVKDPLSDVNPTLTPLLESHDAAALQASPSLTSTKVLVPWISIVFSSSKLTDLRRLDMARTSRILKLVKVVCHPRWT